MRLLTVCIAEMAAALRRTPQLLPPETLEVLRIVDGRVFAMRADVNTLCITFLRNEWDDNQTASLLRNAARVTFDMQEQINILKGNPPSLDLPFFESINDAPSNWRLETGDWGLDFGLGACIHG